MPERQRDSLFASNTGSFSVWGSKTNDRERMSKLKYVLDKKRDPSRVKRGKYADEKEGDRQPGCGWSPFGGATRTASHPFPTA